MATQRTGSKLTQRTLWHSQERSWLTSEELQTCTTSSTTDNNAPHLLVEASASQISLGSERTVITQSLPDETAKRMRVPYMQGEFTEQFTYGYSLVGTVIEGPGEWLQHRVHLLHPHQQYAEVTTAEAYRLPDALDDNRATLISNMETAVNALWDARPSVGDRVVIVGYGLIGALVAELIRRIPGVDLVIVEPDVKRVVYADNAGLTTTAAAPADEADIVFNTATADAAMQSAIEYTCREGTIVDLSWHGGNTSTLMLGGSFHYDRKRLISSQVSTIPTAQSSRWNYQSRKKLVVKLLLELDDRLLIDRTIAFSDTPDFFNSLRQQTPVERSVVIRYQD